MIVVYCTTESVIPMVSNVFFFLFYVSHLSERVETARISQFAFRGFVDEALRSTFDVTDSDPISLPCHRQTSCFKSARSWLLMPCLTGTRWPSFAENFSPAALFSTLTGIFADPRTCLGRVVVISRPFSSCHQSLVHGVLLCSVKPPLSARGE